MFIGTQTLGVPTSSGTYFLLLIGVFIGTQTLGVPTSSLTRPSIQAQLDLHVLQMCAFTRQASGRSVPVVPQGGTGTGVTSNHDKEAHKGSDSVFYSLI